MFNLIKGDITKIHADVIVNAANTKLIGGGGVDGAIHTAAGSSIMLQLNQIRQYGFCPPGQMVITTGGNMPCKYIFHGVGPIWYDEDEQELSKLLIQLYSQCIKTADILRCKSISFPNISTGVYGFPKELAAELVISHLTEWKVNHLEQINFVCFDDENYILYRHYLKASGCNFIEQ